MVLILIRPSRNPWFRITHSAKTHIPWKIPWKIVNSVQNEKFRDKIREILRFEITEFWMVCLMSGNNLSYEQNTIFLLLCSKWLRTLSIGVAETTTNFTLHTYKTYFNRPTTEVKIARFRVKSYKITVKSWTKSPNLSNSAKKKTKKKIKLLTYNFPCNCFKK